MYDCEMDETVSLMQYEMVCLYVKLNCNVSSESLTSQCSSHADLAISHGEDYQHFNSIIHKQRDKHNSKHNNPNCALTDGTKQPIHLLLIILTINLT